MAIQKKLIHFKKLESFQEQLDSNNILDTSIVFIQDAKLIWTHGQYYGSIDEIQTQLEDLINEVGENELVTAAALTDLAEKKADKDSLGDYLLREEANGSVVIVSEDYQALEENYSDLELTPVTPSSTVDAAFSIIEGNLSKISEVIIENELVTATSIINLEKRLDESLNTLTSSDITIGDSFPVLSKFEGYLELTPITTGITLDQALSTIENNFNVISKDLEESDLTIAASLTDLEERKAEKEDFETFSNETESKILELSEEVLNLEEVTAASYTELKDKKLDAELFSDHYSEDPQLEYKKLGGNNVYEKFFSLTYTTLGTEAIWELPCTEENSIVTVLEMSCILQQVLEDEGTISFDYRDQSLLGSNSNTLKYYYKHSSGSLIIKFTSDTTTILTGLFKFSSSNVIAAGDSSSITDEGLIDGGASA